MIASHRGPGATDFLRLALAQINPTVGDIRGNAALIRAARAEKFLAMGRKA